MMKHLEAGTLALLAAMTMTLAHAQDPAPQAAQSTDGDGFDALFADTESDAASPAGDASSSAGEGGTPQGDAAAPAAEPSPPASAESPPLDTIPVRTRATAQAPPPPPRAARQVEEIVVTARKREESLQDAPVVVSALSQKQLERYNVDDMTKIAEMTPQLFVSSGSNGNGGTITMRGIGSSSTTSGFDQAVSINVDGVQYSRATVLHQGYFDVGQVEVLKGPQSLFFGKSSSAGVISLRTADPDSTPEAQLRLGSELEASERWIEGVVSGPLSDAFSARLAARYSGMRGYIENLGTAVIDASNGSTVPAPERDWPEEQQAMARLTLRYQPGDDFDAKLKLSWVDLENGGLSQGTELIDCSATGSAQLNPGQECRGDWKIAQNGLPPDVAATERIWNREHGRLYSIYRSYSGVLALDYSPGDFQISSVTGYYTFDNQYIGDYDFTNASVIVGAEHPKEQALSQELRLLSDFDGALNFMIGGYYQRKQFDFNENTSRLVPLPRDPSTGRYAAFVRDSETQGRAWSTFAQLLWKITDTLDAAAGARYSDEVKDSFSVHRYIHPAMIPILRPAGDPITARTHDTNVSPEVTVSWRPSEGLMLYGAYKKGFKSGGYSNSALLSRATTARDAIFRPETVAGVEGGIKSSLLDGSLQVNLAAYRYEFSDLQVNFFDSANINFITQNAATATTQGAELEWQWLTPIEGLDVHGNASYNRAVYGDFLSFCYAGQSYEAGCNLDRNGQPATTTGDHQDLGGTVRPIAPKFTAGLGVLYRFAVYRNLMLTLTTDTGYVDRYLLNSLGRQVYQSAYFRTDASISLGPESGRWELSLLGRNLSNEYIAYDEGDSPLSGQGTGQHEPLNVLADQVGVVGRPREIGVQFSMRFGGE